MPHLFPPKAAPRHREVPGHCKHLRRLMEETLLIHPGSGDQSLTFGGLFYSAGSPTRGNLRSAYGEKSSTNGFLLGSGSGKMLSMANSFANHELTRKELEEREREYEILAGQIENGLDSLPKMGSVSDPLHSSFDEFYLSLNKKFQEFGLLPQEPLGADFFIYSRELVEPLRAGVKETRDFVKNWRRRQW